jgi:membrane protease subunit (stomatin/prohibitin family)
VAGTAGAVRHRQDQKYAAQDQAQYEEQMAQQQQAAAPPPAAPDADDKFAQLEKLAELQKQGILTDEEFAAEKAKILAS